MLPRDGGGGIPKMGKRRLSFFLRLAAGGVVLGLSLFGFANLLRRPDIPWADLARAAGIPRENLASALVRADGVEVRDPGNETDLFFVAARHAIGDELEFVFRHGGREAVVRGRLVAHYVRETFPLVFLLTGLAGFLIGFGVLFLRPDDPRARIFFWLSIVFSAAVMINGDWYGIQGKALNLVPGSLFLLAYAMTPVALLRFVRTFAPPGRGAASRLAGLRIASVLIGAFFIGALAIAILRPSVEAFRLKKYIPLFRLYFVALAAAAIFHLARAYRASPSREERSRIKWVFAGLAAGLGPFAVFYQLPRGLGAAPLLGEEAASAFFVLLPLALAVAIVKYRLLDIDLLINRSVVYSLLTMLTVAVYLLSVEALKRMSVRAAGPAAPEPGWIPIGAAVTAAALFAPARRGIQALVDKALFRRSYDTRRAGLGFASAAQKTYHADELSRLLDAALNEALPVESVGLFVFDPAGIPPGILVRSGLDDETVSRLIALGPDAGALRAGQGLPRDDFDVAIPLPADEGSPAGWILAGRKKSGLEFTEEDLEFLRTLAVETAAALRRIRLLEQVVYERASREKAEELNRLKTEFISSVSHELRTPMTSLQGLSELLRSGRVRDESRRERLLELLAGECGRLSRFLNNVLDFGRIEQGVKRYDLRPADLRPIVAEVVDLARPAAAAEGVDLSVELPAGPAPAEVDPDAVRQALLNLVDNAVKYGTDGGRVVVRLSAGEPDAVLSVADGGPGIPLEDRERIFDAFFRSPAAARRRPQGVGLGLNIVKHIMDGHGGTVDLRSEPGEGTTFTLRFPKGRTP